MFSKLKVDLNQKSNKLNQKKLERVNLKILIKKERAEKYQRIAKELANPSREREYLKAAQYLLY